MHTWKRPIFSNKRQLPFILLIVAACLLGAFFGRRLCNSALLTYENRYDYFWKAPEGKADFVNWWTSKAFDYSSDKASFNHNLASRYLSSTDKELITKVFWSKHNVPISVIRCSHDITREIPNSDFIEVSRTFVDISKTEMPHSTVRFILKIRKTPEGWMITSFSPRDNSLKRLESLLSNVSVGCKTKLLEQNRSAIRQMSSALQYRNIFLLPASIEEIEKAVSFNPNFSIAYRELGTTYTELKQNKKAIASLEKSVLLNPEDIWANLYLGIAYSDNAEYDKALTQLRKTVVMEPEFYWAHSHLGLELFRAKSYESALKEYLVAKSLYPENWYAYMCTGLTYGQLSQNEKEIEELTQAISLNPKNDVLYNTRSDVYSSKGDWKNALADGNKAIRLAPTSANFACRSRAFFKSFCFDFAIKDANTAIELDCSSPNGFARRGYAKEGRGDLSGALIDFERALELRPDDADFKEECAKIRRLIEEYELNLRRSEAG
ncbi:MAG: hypothetical protein SFY67_10310 [Candidatus Melainabacteria bacterium]|nr:hypothetical protein [Candidatus Melainabacteria bacterium]